MFLEANEEMVVCVFNCEIGDCRLKCNKNEYQVTSASYSKILPQFWLHLCGISYSTCVRCHQCTSYVLLHRALFHVSHLPADL